MCPFSPRKFWRNLGSRSSLFTIGLVAINACLNHSLPVTHYLSGGEFTVVKFSPLEWLFTFIDLLCAACLFLSTWQRIFLVSTSKWMATVGIIAMALLWILACNAHGPQFLYVVLISVVCILLAIPGARATATISAA